MSQTSELLKNAKQKHGTVTAMRLALGLAVSPEFRRSWRPELRFMKGILSVIWFTVSGALTVCWVMAWLDSGFSTIQTTADFFRYGRFFPAVPLDVFLHWGVVFPISLLLWAIRVGDKDSGSLRKRKLAEAMNPSGAYGHARLASTEDLRRARLIGGEPDVGIRLGFDKNTGEMLRYRDRDGHGLIVAPTGSGKNRDFLTAALLDWKGSAIVIDPKGALCAITQRHRRSENGKVIVLNPFENEPDLFPTKLPASSTYNPMAHLKPNAPGFTIACERLADGIVGEEAKEDGQKDAAHFRDRARNLIAGIIMHVAATYPAKQRHLGTVRNIITSADDQDFFTWVEGANEKGSLYVKQKLARFVGRHESEEVGDVLSTAERFTDFIGNETIDPNLRGDGFRFYDAKETKTTVYVVLPLEHMDTCGKWFRLIVASALHELWRKGRGSVPVLIILDEFSQFGTLRIIKSAMNAARNFGIQLLPVLQQLSDLKSLYGENWGGFVNGAAFKLFLSSEDPVTRQYVADLSGMTTVKVPSIDLGDGRNGGSTGPKIGIGEAGQPLKAGYEVGEIPEDEFLLKVRGVPMAEGKRYRYDDEEHCPDLIGKWDPDPYEDTHAAADP
jgi:type IV secretion system protein VirD4